MDPYKVKLSKFLSFILRHAPDQYGLTLDEYGYTSLDKVLDILKSRFKYFKKDDLSDLVNTDPKGRFETGHSWRSYRNESVTSLRFGWEAV